MTGCTRRAPDTDTHYLLVLSLPHRRGRIKACAAVTLPGLPLGREGTLPYKISYDNLLYTAQQIGGVV